jgi:hypothetical protein
MGVTMSVVVYLEDYRKVLCKEREKEKETFKRLDFPLTPEHMARLMSGDGDHCPQK